MLKYNEYTNINKHKSVEIVHELKDEYKTPSFGEFMKDYRTDEKVESSYNDEFASWDSFSSYGPGNSQSQETIKQFAKLSGRKVISEAAGSLLGLAVSR